MEAASNRAVSHSNKIPLERSWVGNEITSIELFIADFSPTLQ